MEEQQKQPEPGTAVAKVEAGELVMLSGLQSDVLNPHKMQTNFPHRGVEAARFITQSLAKEGTRLDDFGDGVFFAKYYIAHVAEFVAEGGEVIPMPRVVLIGPAGETMQFVSEGAIASLDLIRSLMGDGPWEPPLPLSIVKVKTRRGFKTYRLALGSGEYDGKDSFVPSGGSQQEGQAGDPSVRRRKQGS